MMSFVISVIFLSKIVVGQGYNAWFLKSLGKNSTDSKMDIIGIHADHNGANPSLISHS